MDGTTPTAVRRAGVADIPRIVPLFGAYREFYRQAPNPEREREFLTERLPSEESVVFVAEIGGATVGFVQLYPLFSSLSLRRVWLLNDLFVRPDARRHGVGQALLRRAREFARETGAEYLTLETARDNPAQRLYEAEGWVRDEEFFHYQREA